MSEAVLLLAALGTVTAGMAAFALSLDAHWRQVTGSRGPAPGGRVALRLVGALLLVAGFALCAAADPVSMAVLVWTMMLTVGAASVVGLLAWRALRSKGSGRPAR